MDDRTRSLVRGLCHGNERERVLAAAGLGDLLAYAARAGADVDAVAGALVEALSHEPDPVVQEEIAHSLSALVEYGTVPPGIVSALKRRLPELDPAAAEHVQDVLEASTWPRG